MGGGEFLTPPDNHLRLHVWRPGVFWGRQDTPRARQVVSPAEPAAPILFHLSVPQTLPLPSKFSMSSTSPGPALAKTLKATLSSLRCPFTPF